MNDHAIAIVRDLVIMHHNAAYKKDEPRRERLFKLIDEMEFFFPEETAKVLEGSETS